MSLPVLGIVTSAFQEAIAIQESILRTWLTRSGAQSRKLLERFFKDLVPVQIQLDGLWVKVIVHISPRKNSTLAMLRVGI